MESSSMNSDMFWIVVIVIALGVLVIGAVLIFAWRAFADRARGFVNYETYLEFLAKHNIRSNIPKYLNDAYADYLQKRNEFWATYGQVVVACFIIIILAVLMLTKTITAEAGLPILSAVSGFAIAKGVSSAKNMPSNPNDDRQD